MTVFLMSAFCVAKVDAQYVWEVGALIGGASYQGDALPSSPFLKLGAYNEAIIKYNFNDRYSLKFNIGKGTVSGDSKSAGVYLPENESASFEKDFYESAFHLEYNFRPYSSVLDFQETRFTPFIFVGLGVVSHTNASGSKIELNIPFGLGIKYCLFQRLNVGVECGYRKLFSDDFDTQDSNNMLLNDPIQLNKSGLINNDWYSVVGVFITYSFGYTGWTCF